VIVFPEAPSEWQTLFETHAPIFGPITSPA
jgi:hypothetical protein